MFSYLNGWKLWLGWGSSTSVTYVRRCSLGRVTATFEPWPLFGERCNFPELSRRTTGWQKPPPAMGFLDCFLTSAWPCFTHSFWHINTSSLVTEHMGLSFSNISHFQPEQINLTSVLFWPAYPFRGLVLIYYYTSICDVIVTKWNSKIGLALPFTNADQEKTECSTLEFLL